MAKVEKEAPLQAAVDESLVRSVLKSVMDRKVTHLNSAVEYEVKSILTDIGRSDLTNEFTLTTEYIYRYTYRGQFDANKT